MYEEKRMVRQDTFHKWVATVLTVGVLLWGSLAYFIQAEDAKLGLRLGGQIMQLEAQQRVDGRVNELVFAIDKKLSNIEQSLLLQGALMQEVHELRKEVNDLKLEIAKKHK